MYNQIKVTSRRNLCRICIKSGHDNTWHSCLCLTSTRYNLSSIIYSACIVRIRNGSILFPTSLVLLVRLLLPWILLILVFLFDIRFQKNTLFRNRTFRTCQIKFQFVVARYYILPCSKCIRYCLCLSRCDCIHCLCIIFVFNLKRPRVCICFYSRSHVDTSQRCISCVCEI